MTAYYNEFDPKAAAWLRELIRQGLIAPGNVDERSIEDVRPTDLIGYDQCHFFAGIGVWSYALRCAGWPDDRPVWTGSCPCQPFSAAGKGGGFDDERHLWPAFHWLIEQCRPPVVLGEQVASKDGLGWLDLVHADLEGSGYAAGALDLCAAGVGAPHIRQRLYWAGKRLADAECIGPAAGIPASARGYERHAEELGDGGDRRTGPDAGRSELLGLEHTPSDGRLARRTKPSGWSPASRRGLVGVEHANSAGREPGQRDDTPAGHRPSAAAASEPVGMADPNGGDAGASSGAEDWHGGWVVGDDARPSGADDRTGPTNGLWRDADWLFCRDGKWRPVEPGTFPLAYGAPERVGRLRGYGNAIVAPAAQAFIEAYLETEADRHLRLTEVSEVAPDKPEMDIFQ